MKNSPIHILIFLTLFIFSSCGSPVDENTKDNSSTSSSQKENEGSSSSGVTYSPKEDMVAFIESINFSSLCFTEKNMPEYVVERKGDRHAQYKFVADDEKGEIQMSITFSDYENSIYADEDDPGMPQYMFETVFKQKRKSGVFYTKTTDVKNLGSDAYFGYNDRNKEKMLAVRLNNVSFTIQLNRIDREKTCLLTDVELIKFGSLVVEQIKKQNQ